MLNPWLNRPQLVELKELIFLPRLFFEARADIGEICFVVVLE